MPPKPKFNKEEILNAAFDIARTHGLDAVKAREVGEALGCSSRPIFTFFPGMEELQKCVVQKTWLFFGEYLAAADNYVPAFKMRGMLLVKFAQEEPHLFRILFMNKNEETEFAEMMQKRLRSFTGDFAAIEKNCHLSYEEALKIFNALWVQAYGICCMIVHNHCIFTEAQVGGLLSSCFAGQMLLLKSGRADTTDFYPVKKGSEEAAKYSRGNEYA